MAEYKFDCSFKSYLNYREDEPMKSLKRFCEKCCEKEIEEYKKYFAESVNGAEEQISTLLDCMINLVETFGESVAEQLIEEVKKQALKSE